MKLIHGPLNLGPSAHSVHKGGKLAATTSGGGDGFCDVVMCLLGAVQTMANHFRQTNEASTFPYTTDVGRSQTNVLMVTGMSDSIKSPLNQSYHHEDIIQDLHRLQCVISA